MVVGGVLYASEFNLIFSISFQPSPLYISITIPILFQFSVLFKTNSKPALTEGLEIDQYIWAILNTLGSTPIEEVIIDSDANWKSVQGINTTNIKVIIFQVSMGCGCVDFTVKCRQALLHNNNESMDRYESI